MLERSVISGACLCLGLWTGVKLTLHFLHLHSFLCAIVFLASELTWIMGSVVRTTDLVPRYDNILSRFLFLSLSPPP